MARALPAPELRLVAVCTGNICRSPTAEYVLRAKLAAAGLGDRVAVSSCGTYSGHEGEPADPRTERIAVQRGYEDIKRHRARSLHREDFDADLLLALDAGHKRSLIREAPSTAAECKVKLLREYERPKEGASGSATRPAARAGGGGGVAAASLDVEDPYYGDAAGFVRVLEQVEAAADGVVEACKRALAASPRDRADVLLANPYDD